MPARRRRPRCSPRCRRTRWAAGARRIGSCVAEHPRHGGRPHRARRHPGGRPADRRAAAADLLRAEPGAAARPASRSTPTRPTSSATAGRPAPRRCCARRRDATGASSARARQFEGAWSYLELLAEAAGARRPAGRRAWSRPTGSAATCSTRSTPRRCVARLRDRFRGQPGGTWRAAPGPGGSPHHSFQVFEVYPWAGLLRAAAAGAPRVGAGPVPDPGGRGASRSTASRSRSCPGRWPGTAPAPAGDAAPPRPSAGRSTAGP